MARLSLYTIFIAAASVAVACTISMAFADEVSDPMEKARMLYDRGDLTGAAESLMLATVALRLKQQGQLAHFLPAAPAGYRIEMDEEAGKTAAMMGMGGVTVRAEYFSDSGDSFTISMSADSKMAHAMAPMFDNAQIMAMAGDRILNVSGHKLLVQEDKIAGMIAHRILISADGPDPDRLESVLRQIDFDGLAGFDGHAPAH